MIVNVIMDMTVHLSTLCRNLHSWTKIFPKGTHSVY